LAGKVVSETRLLLSDLGWLWPAAFDSSDLAGTTTKHKAKTKAEVQSALPCRFLCPSVE